MSARGSYLSRCRHEDEVFPWFLVWLLKRQPRDFIFMSARRNYLFSVLSYDSIASPSPKYRNCKEVFGWLLLVWLVRRIPRALIVAPTFS